MTNDVVFKYRLHDERNKVMLPRGAQVLHVHAQNDRVCFWARHAEKVEELEMREFWVVGDGKVLHAEAGWKWQYLGTAHTYGGRTALHVFEVRCDK